MAEGFKMDNITEDKCPKSAYNSLENVAYGVVRARRARSALTGGQPVGWVIK